MATFFDDLKKTENPYRVMKLKENPFSISPLFKDFKDHRECKQEEGLFVLPPELRREIKMILLGKDQRALIHGLYGVGKTSIVDFTLYLAHNFHNRFCIRTIVTEDNVNRAINEVLLTLCFEILNEINSKNMMKPAEAIRKWVTEKKYSDVLWNNLLRLTGKYSEKIETRKGSKSPGKLNIHLGPIGANFGSQEEVETRKTIQSYIDVLPMTKVTEYLKDFQEIISMMGYKNIIIFIDEADHLGEISSFLKMLTKAREVLFSKGYTFLIAGSVEVAKHVEAMGSIFDKIIFVKPANSITFRQILGQRIKAIQTDLEITDIFEESALRLIHEKSGGIRKNFLRLSENAIDVAAYHQAIKVTQSHCQTVLRSGEDEISLELRELHIDILKYLTKKGRSSSSNNDFQSTLQIKRAHLRTNLEELVKLGYVRKEKRGRAIYYDVLAQFRPYFGNK